MRIMIASFCKLGDTVSLLPSLWALRKAYPHAHICLASEYYPGSTYVTAADLLRDVGLIDSFAARAITSNICRKALNRVWLVLRNSFKRWDIGIVLMSPYPPATQAVLDTLRKHLRRFRVRQIIGPSKTVEFDKSANGFLNSVTHVSDSLVEILRPLGIPLPAPQQGRFELPPFEPEKDEVDMFLKGTGLACKSKPLVAVAISSNMPAKVWPRERFIEVLKRLHRECDVYPLLFGAGKESTDIKAAIVELEHHGLPILDRPLRWVAELLRRCDFYLGNDTGIMHLAAAVGLPCVAVFSSRTAPGEWYPYGRRHAVFRSQVTCENCQLVECIEMGNACLKQIPTKPVLLACRKLLGKLAVDCHPS